MQRMRTGTVAPLLGLLAVVGSALGVSTNPHVLLTVHSIVERAVSFLS
jgi:hypothetical protein